LEKLKHSSTRFFQSLETAFKIDVNPMKSVGFPSG
jgi:hypothetical protein